MYKQHVTAHREGGYRGGWRPSRSLPRWHLDAFGAEAAKEGGGWWPSPRGRHQGGYHIDFGNGHREVSTDSGEFDLAAYVEAPWLIVLVCLTAVEEEGGPTALLPGSHLQMARALAALRPAPQPSAEPRLTIAQHVWAVRRARRRARLLGAGARDGPRRRRLLLHPLLVHAATVSRAGAAPRAVLNVPHPFPSARVAKKAGAFSAVTLPVRRALGARRPIPRAVLALLLRVAVVAARASLSALPRRRGWQALAAVPAKASPLSLRRFRRGGGASLRAAVISSVRGSGPPRMNTCGSTTTAAAGSRAAAATAAADVGAAVRRWIAPSAKAETGDEEERTEYVAMLEQRPLLPRAAQAAAEP